MKKILLPLLAVALLVLGIFFLRPKPWPEKTAEVKESGYRLPVKNFKEGVTKKPFGIYITPEKSPVLPERFKGYHTGIDIEEIQGEKVPVMAIADGEVIYSGWVSGYGGVLGLKTDKFLVLYGHLDATTIPKVGAQVTAGENVGLLGIGYSKDTDFERQHLHFGVISVKKFDLRGYVQNQEELANWLNPASLF